MIAALPHAGGWLELQASRPHDLCCGRLLQLQCMSCSTLKASQACWTLRWSEMTQSVCAFMIVSCPLLLVMCSLPAEVWLACTASTAWCVLPRGQTNLLWQKQLEFWVATVCLAKKPDQQKCCLAGMCTLYCSVWLFLLSPAMVRMNATHA